MKRILISLLFYLSISPAGAQTETSPYRPGITEEGAIYFLPKTAVRVTVQVEKTTYTPGEFCKYADRYLRLKNVQVTPSVSYRITTIRQEATGVADTSKCFAVKFDPRTVASNIALSDDGVLLAINAGQEVRGRIRDYNSLASHTTPLTPEDPRQYMSEEILAAGSTAKMAELTAQDIYEIRESRNLLIRGQADNMPKDGTQLKLMLNQLDLQDRALTSLFAGTTVRDTTEQVITYVPDKEVKHELLFRFSQKLGLVDADDLAGVPYYISIMNLHTVPMEDPEAKKKAKPQPGIYVNVPGKMKVILSNIDGDLLTKELPASQFGHTELLSGVLFNKRYTTHLWLNPVTGAVERLDAEQPK